MSISKVVCLLVVSNEPMSTRDACARTYAVACLTRCAPEQQDGWPWHVCGMAKAPQPTTTGYFAPSNKKRLKVVPEYTSVIHQSKSSAAKLLSVTAFLKLTTNRNGCCACWCGSAGAIHEASHILLQLGDGLDLAVHAHTGKSPGAAHNSSQHREYLIIT